MSSVPNQHHPQDDRRSANVELSANDKRLLDALIDNEFDTERLEPLTEPERERVRVLMGMFGLMNDYPVDDAEATLVHATLARIDRHEANRAKQFSYDEQRKAGAGTGGGRLPNLVGVAAAILLVAGIVWPMLNTVRQHSIDAACQNNMRMMAYAFGHYAADNNDALPVAMAGFGRRSWDNFSNHVNLGPLLEGQYCERGHLNCPGHHSSADASYSYQWQKPGTRLTWQTGRVTIILGDRNPIMDAARRGVVLSPDTHSRNHGGRGQNALATDGATLWLDRTVVGGKDNIWLPHGVNRLKSGVAPKDPHDVFLAH